MTAAVAVALAVYGVMFVAAGIFIGQLTREIDLLQDTVARHEASINVISRTRPCCHATGPNHHPACTTNRTEQQQ